MSLAMCYRLCVCLSVAPATGLSVEEQRLMDSIAKLNLRLRSESIHVALHYTRIDPHSYTYTLTHVYTHIHTYMYVYTRTHMWIHTDVARAHTLY